MPGQPRAGAESFIFRRPRCNTGKGNEYEIRAPEAWLDMRRFFSNGIADFITELAETVEQMRREGSHTSNHFAEYETLGFDYLKAASGC